VAFADDLTTIAKAIEDEVVATLCAKWNAQHPAYTPGLYADPVTTRQHFGIAEAFQPWSLLPDPAAFQPVSDSLKQAMGLLRVDAQFTDPVDPSDQFGLARQEYQALVNEDPINNWSGATADNFRTKFMDHFKANTENEAIMISVLKAALEAHSTLWANARNDIMSIAKKTVAAMQINTGGGCDQNAWVMLFSALSGIASIAAVPLSGGGSLLMEAMTVTAIGAAGSMATNAIPIMNADDSNSYHADNLEDGITAMKSAMAALQERVEIGLAAIAMSLTANVAFIEAEKQSIFMMAKPTLSTNDPSFTPGR
jgi:hypothetical protein